MRIIGVAKDSKYFTLGETQRLALYQPCLAHDEPVNLHFIIRTAGSPSGYVKRIQEMLGRLDPTAAIETKPMIRALGVALLPSQAGAAMLGAMGVLGLVLAAIGLYGGLLYTVWRSARRPPACCVLCAGTALPWWALACWPGSPSHFWPPALWQFFWFQDSAPSTRRLSCWPRSRQPYGRCASTR